MSVTAKKPTEKKPTTTKPTAKASTKPAAVAKVTKEKVPAPKAVAKAPKTVAKKIVETGPQLVPALTHEQIARRAYEIWAGRGYRQGDPVHDWWQAEQDLKRA